MIRLAIAGASGRMGRCVVELAELDQRFQIVAKIDRGTESSNRNLLKSDVLIDFTDAAGTMEWLTICHDRRIPMVIGATGHDPLQLARIVEVSKSIPVVKAANFSIGINNILQLIGKLAAELGDAYDIEIVETHHRNKTDAPSGTALALAEAIAGQSVESRCTSGRQEVQSRARKEAGPPLIHGRSGHTGVRPKGEIAIHAVRMGDVIGKHEIHFSGPGETITITHAAHSRATFAAGALRAAEWVIGRAPKLYAASEAIG